MGKDIFISYSRKDTAVADRICNALDRAGISYFIDRKGIAGGMEFPEILAHAIVDCKIFLFLASRNSYQSDYTANEITFAFNRKRKMLPYIIDGSELPLALEFSFPSIKKLNYDTQPCSYRYSKKKAAPRRPIKIFFDRNKTADTFPALTEQYINWPKSTFYGHFCTLTNFLLNFAATNPN